MVREFGSRIAEALSLCINHAEKFYTTNPLSNKWSPPWTDFILENCNHPLLKILRRVY